MFATKNAPNRAKNVPNITKMFQGEQKMLSEYVRQT